MDTPEYKRIAVIVTAVAVSVLTWWATHSWLTGINPFTDYGSMVWPAVMIILQAGIIGLAWMLLERPLDCLAAILASWALFVLFFSPDVWYISALPVFAAFWYIGSRRIQHDVHERSKLRLWSGLDRGVRLILLGTYLMISLGFYLLPVSRATDVSAISKGLQGSAQSTYNSDFVKSQLDQLPPSQQAQVRQEIGAQIDAQVRKWLGPLGPLLPPILAFGLFVTLWGFSFIFRELGLALSVALFAFLKKTGFVQVGEKDVKAEVLKM